MDKVRKSKSSGVEFSSSRVLAYSILVTTFIYLLTSTFCMVGILIGKAHAAESEGESMNAVFRSDRVIEGDLDGCSMESITVDGVSFSFCSRYRVYDLHNGLTSPEFLTAAERVKLFVDKNRNCVRKVIITRSSR